ncbi:hypothetical protein NQ317_006631 [Molorchus minor]|uniref:IMD domain-containing protein n=1 Tax=Molorchus minor TaxID=1323400 RepID=A0ABQ9J1U2_9CUCU|nr:hypothetical protein NQ317_006631 [Molorchus minor]
MRITKDNKDNEDKKPVHLFNRTRDGSCLKVVHLGGEKDDWPLGLIIKKDWTRREFYCSRRDEITASLVSSRPVASLTVMSMRHKGYRNSAHPNMFKTQSSRGQNEKFYKGVIMECLIMPLQEKLEEWKRTVINLDKEHAKDYKRARAELKKRSTDTLRLQKKMRKGAGGDVQKRFECGLQDVTERRLLKPVVHEEVAMLTEMGHLQEAVQQLEKHASDPNTLPPASEQVIADLKSSDSGWSFQTPPSSPSSLGSRKSSMCSISSINSSSSSSSKSHHSSESSALAKISVTAQVSGMSEHSNNSSSSSTPCTPFPVATIPTTTATWPNLQETVQFERAASAIISDRPHTISSAYEKGHQRPPLTVYTFQAPDQSLSQPASPVTSTNPTNTLANTIPPKGSSASVKSLSKPPLPTRSAKTIAGMQGVRVLPPGAELPIMEKKPSALPIHLSKSAPQPTYVNMHELASMAASKAQEKEKANFPPPPAEFISPPEKVKRKVALAKAPWNHPAVHGSQTTFTAEDPHHLDDVNGTASKYCTLPRSNELLNAVRRRPLSMTGLLWAVVPCETLFETWFNANTKTPTTDTKNIFYYERGIFYGQSGAAPPPPAFLLDPTPTQPKAQTPGGVVYAQPSQVMGGSPNAIRRVNNFRSQSADRKSDERVQEVFFTPDLEETKFQFELGTMNPSKLKLRSPFVIGGKNRQKMDSSERVPNGAGVNIEAA